MLGAITQFETDIRAERQIDGVAKAKRNGVQFGAQRQLADDQNIELQAKRRDGVSIKTLMREDELSNASVYR